MKVTAHSAVPVYTISGSSTARPLPEWLARKRKRSLKQDPEYANRIELLQDFEFEEASQCIRISDDGDWIMSTGVYMSTMRKKHTDKFRNIQTADTHSLFTASITFIRSTYNISQHYVPVTVYRLHQINTPTS
jgi:ribosome biogenesis protein ENP2